MLTLRSKIRNKYIVSQTMNKYTWCGLGFTILTAFSLLSASCSNSSSRMDADTIDSTSTAPEIADSTKIEVESKADSREPLGKTFTSSTHALEFMKASGHWDEYSNGILPRMAEENLEYCSKLLNSRYPYFIVVDKSKMKVILYNRFGVKTKEYGMACSRNYGQKRGQWDSRTPEGFFEAEGIYDSTNWKFTNAAGYTSPARGVYGTRFIRIKAPQTSSCGIHGTSSPGSIGHRASHGCVRVTNENILDLVKYAEPGMPIIVNPGPLDLRANADAGIHVPTITTDGVPVEIAAPSVSKSQANVKAKNEVKNTSPSTNDKVVREPEEQGTVSEEKVETSEPTIQETTTSPAQPVPPTQPSQPVEPVQPSEPTN